MYLNESEPFTTGANSDPIGHQFRDNEDEMSWSGRTEPVEEPARADQNIPYMTK